MSARFNQLADALQAQHRAQIALLGGVAHDLRGPLGTLQLAIDVIASDVQPQQQRLVETARRQITRLERLSRDFLNIAKLDVGDLELEYRVEDIRRLVGESAEQGRASSGRLALSLPNDPVLVRCDTLRIEQAVSNLVSNALKYSPESAPVELTLSTGDGEAVLRVTDHGIGISPDDQRTLFQAFRRAAASKNSVPGMGLGLWMARRIIVAHGGWIDVSSIPGRGSTFALHLPLFDAQHPGPVGQRARFAVASTHDEPRAPAELVARCYDSPS